MSTRPGPIMKWKLAPAKIISSDSANCSRSIVSASSLWVGSESYADWFRLQLDHRSWGKRVGDSALHPTDIYYMYVYIYIVCPLVANETIAILIVDNVAHLSEGNRRADMAHLKTNEKCMDRDVDKCRPAGRKCFSCILLHSLNKR